MLMLLGYLLVIVGLALVILAVLVWLGFIKPAQMPGVGPWDVLTELAKRAPWAAVVGIILIYFGLKILGVPLPF